MLKKLMCLGVCTMLVITLSGCNKENTINEYDKEIEVSVTNNETDFYEIMIEEDVKQYIEKIYPLPAETPKAFPVFDEITHADKGWIWTTSLKQAVNDINYFSYSEEIDKTAHKLYGENVGDFLTNYKQAKIEKFDDEYYGWLGNCATIDSRYIYEILSMEKKDNIYKVMICEYLGEYNFEKDIETKQMMGTKTLMIKYNEQTKQYNILSCTVNNNDDLELEKTKMGKVENNAIKITKQDILERLSSLTPNVKYINLCSELKSPLFKISDGVELLPDLKYEVDMNGDNILEKIHIEDGNVYINDTVYAQTLDRAFVIDLNRNDKKLELALEGITDIGVTEFLLYDGKKVKHINGFSGVSIDGFGNIIDFYDETMGIAGILTGFCKLTDDGVERQDTLTYNKNTIYTSSKLIFSEDYNQIKQCIDYLGGEGEKFESYREKAKVLEEGTTFNLIDVYGEKGYDAVPFVRLQDGRKGYVVDYYAIEDAVRYK